MIPGPAALSVGVELNLAPMQADQLLADPQPQARASTALDNNTSITHHIENTNKESVITCSL